MQLVYRFLPETNVIKVSNRQPILKYGIYLITRASVAKNKILIYGSHRILYSVYSSCYTRIDFLLILPILFNRKIGRFAVNFA